MLGEGGVGAAEGGKDGWIEGKEKGMRDRGMDGWKERKGGRVHPLLKGLKDIKSFWESDYSMQREKLAL